MLSYSYCLDLDIISCSLWFIVRLILLPPPVKLSDASVVQGQWLNSDYRWLPTLSFSFHQPILFL